MFISVVCIGFFIVSGVILSWYEDVRRRRARRDYLSSRVRRIIYKQKS